MKTNRILRAFCFGFAALLVLGCASCSRVKHTDPVVKINGIAFRGQGTAELAQWRDEEKANICDRFSTEIRAILNSHSGYLLEGYKGLDTAELDVIFRQIASSQERFIQALSRLDDLVGKKLNSLAVNPSPFTEIMREGTFEDFFPPSVPSVLIDGVAYNALAITALREKLDGERASVYDWFNTEFSTLLERYTYYLLENHEDLDPAELEDILGQIVLLQKRFIQDLSGLDDMVGKGLNSLVIDSSLSIEVTRAGAFGDFFPPSVPLVLIDGVAYNALAVAALRKEMERISAVEWAAMASELDRIINEQFDIRVSNSPAFADWYWGFGNTIFKRPWKKLWGKWDQIRDSKFDSVVNAGVDADAHLRAIHLFKAKSDLLFFGLFYTLGFCENTAGNERPFTVQGIMSMEDFFKPYTLDANIARAGAIFGFDTSAWNDYYSRVDAGIYVAFKAADIAAIVISIATLNPWPLIIDLVFGSWDIIAYPFTVSKNRENMKEEIREFLNSERARLLTATNGV